MKIGWDIGRRFLGIECENNTTNDTRCNDAVKDSHDDVVLQFADNDDRNDATTTPKQETTNQQPTSKPVSNTSNYSTTSSNKLSKEENVNADRSNDDIVSKDTHANDNNKDTLKETNLNCEKDELVLDVLNDDLIEKVRVKISCKLNGFANDHSFSFRSFFFFFFVCLFSSYSIRS